MSNRTATAEEKVMIRTVSNLLICSVDLFPGIGLAVPMIADLAKVARKWDLTPDVRKSVAFSFLGIELISFGIVPSYIILTVWQLYKDLPILKRIITGQRKARVRLGKP